MSKLLRKQMVEELSKQLEKVDSFVLFSYNKLNTYQAYKLRKELRANNIKIKVVKNTIAKIVFQKLYQPNMDNLLSATTALVYGGDSFSSVCKTLQDWNKKEKILVMKGGYINGRCLSPKELDMVAKLPSKTILLSMLAGSFTSIMSQTATVMKAPLQKMCLALHELHVKKCKE